jgi:hypothetical protein
LSAEVKLRSATHTTWDRVQSPHLVLTWRISAESAVLPVPQGARPDGLGDSGAAGDPPGAVPVQAVAVRGEDTGPRACLVDLGLWFVWIRAGE